LSFHRLLRTQTDSLWQAILTHPMVRSIGDGTLDPAPFRRWLTQDYRYLIEYSRIFALGAAKAPDLRRMTWFAELLHATLAVEMDGHRRYAAEFGLSPADLEAIELAPWCRSYTREMLTAASGTFGDLLATLVPCMAGYAETGLHLIAQGLPEHPQYRAWVQMYENSSDWPNSASPCWTRLQPRPDRPIGLA
jgi:thiaminase/transcriptional activator TenA